MATIFFPSKSDIYILEFLFPFLPTKAIFDINGPAVPVKDSIKTSPNRRIAISAIFKFKFV